MFVVAERYEASLVGASSTPLQLPAKKNLARFAAMSLKNEPGGNCVQSGKISS